MNEPWSGTGQWAPHARHTAWQRFVRFLFRYIGTAQTGLPPYPTPDEIAALQDDAARRRSPASGPPPGYEVRVYTDASGVEHRSIVRRDPPATPRDGEEGPRGDIPGDPPRP